MITKISTYRIFKEYFKIEKALNEGLIKTHDIFDSFKIINNYLSSNDIGIFIDNSKVEDNKILISFDKTDTIKFSGLLTTLTNLGYFVSKIKVYKDIKGKDIKYNYNFSDFRDLYFTEDNFKLFTQFDLVLEPKYDITYTPKSNILYHVTQDIYVDKILKKGLILRSDNVLSMHPERIYFTENIKDANTYIKSKTNYYNQEISKNVDIQIGKNMTRKMSDNVYVILQIDINNLNIIYYKDPNYSKGLYTLDNIPPNNITIVK